MNDEKKENGEICSAASRQNGHWCGVLKWAAAGLAGFAIVVLIFGAGMAIGGMKARFSYRWAESYHKNFAGPRSGFFGDWRTASPLSGDFIESHGTFGSIVKIENGTIIVRSEDGVEKNILVSEDVIISRGRETIKVFDFKPGDRVVIIGSPNEQGQIEAKLIRVFGGGKIKELPYKQFRPRFF